MTAEAAIAELEAADLIVTKNTLDFKLEDYDAKATVPKAGEKVSPKTVVKLVLVKATDRIEAREKAEAEKKQQEEAERQAAAAAYDAAPISKDTASDLCLNLLVNKYSNSDIRLVSVTQTDTGWTVKEEVQPKKSPVSHTAECYISGTNGTPNIDDLVEY